MKQLTGVDAGFLTMETATSFGHVGGLSLFDRPDDPSFDPYLAFRHRLESKLDLLEPFRRRLVEVPLNLDHPYWIDDPDFDLDFHVRHIAVPPPGTVAELEALVGRLTGRPLDRRRPLWEAYVIEGLAGGQFAVFHKVHHATIDGAAGAELLSMLLDTDPGEVAVAEPWMPSVEPVPDALSMLLRTGSVMVRRPERAVRVGINAVRSIGSATRSHGIQALAQALTRPMPGPAGDMARRRAARARAREDAVPLLPTRPAPRTVINGSITPHRLLSVGSVPLNDVKALKAHLGTTVNDVAMALCAGALRRYLLDKDDLPDEPLVAMVPVSIRTGDEPDRWTNRVSALFVPLPTAVADPVERVRHAQATMIEAKRNFELLPADLLTDAAEFLSPALATRAMRLATRARLGDRVRPVVNLVISNVPGPRVPLYLGDARLLHYYPVSTIAEGQGLNITLHSYLDGLDLGLVACREMVPDVATITRYIEDELDVLYRAIGQNRPSTAAPSRPQPKRRGARRAVAPRS